MGFRYRKSINLGGGFRVNISNSGVGYSWGGKGYRVTKTAKGTTRRTVSIPGTGISFVDETGRKKGKSHTPTNPQQINNAMDNNHYGTEEIVNSVTTDMVSEGLEEILSAVRRTIKANQIANIGIWLFLFLIFVNPFFIFFWFVSIALKIYVKTAGRINLEYIIDADQKAVVNQRTNPMLKITESEQVWRIIQSSKVINRKYSGGASTTVVRTPCKASKMPPFPFKANVPAASFKTKKETLVFLPDKLFIIQKNKVGALSYSDVLSSAHTTRFQEDEKVPKDTQVVGQTWRYINKSGGPDKRFKNNFQIPICLYGKLELKSASGLNTVIMFSNPSII